MNRTEILETYKVENGTICDLGKFENEPIFAPYFSEYASEGEELAYMEYGCGSYVSLIEVSDEDRTEFPELGNAKYVLLTESDNGFVYCETIETEAAANEIRAEYEPDENNSETLTITLPDYWASYIINGDASGLTEDERAICDRAIERECGDDWTIVDVSDDGLRFTWSYRLYNPEADCDGGSVVDYTAIRIR